MVNLNGARIKRLGHVTLVIPNAQGYLERTVQRSRGAQIHIPVVQAGLGWLGDLRADLDPLVIQFGDQAHGGDLNVVTGCSGNVYQRVIPTRYDCVGSRLGKGTCRRVGAHIARDVPVVGWIARIGFIAQTLGCPII